ncbi:uncharacterized protein LOC142233072 isoform X2 [Haematobia irritans]|uniref:uncharacterized protein LOC142233072 isoform X2 n=1 Tax=Haematobia irritans TaxID=7368 RepID=UPI003F4FC578
MEKAKFIDVVKKYPILYDPNHEDYRNIPKKEKIWRNIGRQFYTSGDNLKRVWKNLKDTYSRQTRLVNADSSRKKWIWSENMKFFRPFVTQVNNTSNRDNSNSGSDECEETYYTNDMPQLVPKTEYITSSNDYDHYNDDNQLLYLGEPHEAPPPLIASIKTESSSFNDMPHIPAKRKCVAAQDAYSPEYPAGSMMISAYDDVDCLLLAHAKTIKKFSPKRQAIAKYKIAQVILEQELLHAQDNSSGSIEKIE